MIMTRAFGLIALGAAIVAAFWLALSIYSMPSDEGVLCVSCWMRPDNG